MKYGLFPNVLFYFIKTSATIYVFSALFQITIVRQPLKLFPTENDVDLVILKSFRTNLSYLEANCVVFFKLVKKVIYCYISTFPHLFVSTHLFSSFVLIFLTNYNTSF